MALHWEKLKGAPHYSSHIFRARIPGGWLVTVNREEYTLTFVPDPSHAWDGNSYHYEDGALVSDGDTPAGMGEVHAFEVQPVASSTYPPRSRQA